MAVIEMQYPSLLNGVSQQTPRERTNGQLTEQNNMMSDPVTGLRRRPGLKRQTSKSTQAYAPNQIYSQYLQIGDTSVNVVINTASGTLHVYDTQWTQKLSYQDNYFKATDAKSINVTNNSGLGWILNKEQKPTTVASTKSNPGKSGFITIKTGAFLKEYQFRIAYKRGSSTGQVDINYQTPKGDASGDAAISVPESIAGRLKDLIQDGKTFQDGNNAATGSHNLNSYMTVYQEGPTLFLTLKSSTSAQDYIKITNKSGSSYASASSAGKVRDTTQIPASIPSQGDGWILGVGTSNSAMEYYSWNYDTLAWDECGSYDSITAIQNMPRQLSVQDGQVKCKAVDFEGRSAGDDQNNPYPYFVSNGITGIGTFMGRLVLLSGAYVCLSASRYPTRTMRSTVTDVLDSDPIELASGSASSASFEHAVQFNKDLIVFASTHQAVIPTGTTALTPTNAMLVLTAQQSVDTTARPSVVGQTLMYATPISSQYFGVGELTPSNYTNSVYTPQNLTDHIPKYFKGKCRQIISGGSINMALFSSTTNYKQIYVHEYFWSGTQRQQVAWHKWTFPVQVCSMHFAKDKIIFVLKQSGTSYIVASIDPRSSQYLTSRNTKPFLDFCEQLAVTNKKITLPSWLSSAQKIVFASTTEGLQCQPVICTKNDDGTYTPHRSYKTSTIFCGVPYESRAVPNSPILFTGQNRRMISDTKDTLIYATITTQNTGYFNIGVSDDRSIETRKNTRSPILWSSKDLDLNQQKIASVYDTIVPCRTNAHTTNLQIYTDGTKELNILTLVYTLRIHTKSRRRQM